MSTSLTTTPQHQEDALAFIQNPEPAALEAAIAGDLSKLTTPQRLQFMKAVCDSIQVNVLTQPFEFITLNGKLKMYAKKDLTEQLRRRDNVSLSIVSRAVESDILTVTTRAHLPNGRFDEDLGSVNIKGLAGEALANAQMKATTKSKRRATLSICGLGFLDESELEDIPRQVQPMVRDVSPPPAEEDLVPLDRITHWNQLLPDRWRDIKVEGMEGDPVPIVDVVNDEKLFAALLPPDDCLERHAMFCGYYARYIESGMNSKGWTAGQMNQLLREKEMIPATASILDCPGDQLEELRGKMREALKKKKTEPAKE